jgi:aspartate kinase
MGLIVQKFGGTSLATIALIKGAARRLVETKRRGHQVIAVVSARGDMTDELHQLARQVSATPPRRELDALVATGEQQSVALMAIAIHELGEPAISFAAGQIGIYTDSQHTRARIVNIDPRRILQELEQDRVVIVAGFQGVDEQLNITTLGRGGSDTTAVALAGVLGAELCEIYTDVDGVYTADPHIVPRARKLDCITYDEMLELASLGAGVMHSRSLEFAKKYRVPLCVRSSFHNGPGTLIVEETEDMEQVVVRGAALTTDEAKITLHQVPDRPGVAAVICEGLDGHSINMDMIVQNTGEDGLTDFSFTVAKSELQESVAAVEEAARQVGAKRVSSDPNIAKVSVVGVGMRIHTGVAARMFRALADANVNIQMISTSEIKISCIVDASDGERALQAAHQAFALDKGDGSAEAPQSAGTHT